jgi:hypothetical protein
VCALQEGFGDSQVGKLIEGTALESEWGKVVCLGRIIGHHWNLNRMSTDPFAKLQVESDRHRLNLIRTELALCFTFSTIAARRYETGNQESAQTSMAKAEKAYETVLQILSDPKHFKHLTQEIIQETTGELERLRARIDGLRQRFKK